MRMSDDCVLAEISDCSSKAIYLAIISQENNGKSRDLELIDGYMGTNLHPFPITIFSTYLIGLAYRLHDCFQDLRKHLHQIHCSVVHRRNLKIVEFVYIVCKISSYILKSQV